MTDPEDDAEIAATLASEYDSGVLTAALYVRLLRDGDKLSTALLAHVQAIVTNAEADHVDATRLRIEATRLADEACAAYGAAIVRLTESEAKARP